MFSQKKNIFKGKIFYVVVIFLLAFGYWINADLLNKDDPDETEALKNQGLTNEQEVSTEDKTVLENAKLTIQLYDDRGNLSREQEVLLPNDLIGMSLDTARTYIGTSYSDYSIKELKEDRITIYKVASQEALTSNLNGDSDETEAIDNEQKSPYYLVKAVNEIITIYYFDENGQEMLVRELDIPFSLLSESDQELFLYGIIKDSEEDLNELLQDFES